MKPGGFYFASWEYFSQPDTGKNNESVIMLFINFYFNISDSSAYAASLFRNIYAFNIIESETGIMEFAFELPSGQFMFPFKVRSFSAERTCYWGQRNLGETAPHVFNIRTPSSAGGWIIWFEEFIVIEHSYSACGANRLTDLWWICVLWKKNLWP